jgi:hypothetical protein
MYIKFSHKFCSRKKIGGGNVYLGPLWQILVEDGVPEVDVVVAAEQRDPLQAVEESFF